MCPSMYFFYRQIRFYYVRHTATISYLKKKKIYIYIYIYICIRPSLIQILIHNNSMNISFQIFSGLSI
ncbi:MAG: hypothetical protein N7Q72_00435, partial [Spiroplasma sp. Tabriz.8]|nr:hypothetical protein [Spiroplasma sp. Tabriz.8]